MFSAALLLVAATAQIVTLHNLILFVDSCVLSEYYNSACYVRR